MGRLVQIVPAAGELLDAAVQHRGDVQLFRQMRPARFQPEHLFILLLDGDQEHQDHRNADGQIDQRQAIVHDLDRDREQRQHRCRDLHPVDPASLLRPIIFCDPEVQTRHRTEQTAPQQQHTVYDFATHPVSSFRVDPKIHPYCTLFFLTIAIRAQKKGVPPMHRQNAPSSESNQDRIMRSFANSPPLAIWNLASRSETCRFFFSSPETS